jgi:hypothetical protein
MAKGAGYPYGFDAVMEGVRKDVPPHIHLGRTSKGWRSAVPLADLLPTAMFLLANIIHVHRYLL